MKRYLAGIATGALVAILTLIFLGARPAPDDSVKFYIERLETLMKNEIAKNQDNGRYQLQSFAIDRTHWHYVLDTATGELYRLELNQSPANSKWVLLTEANFTRP
ncbi:MAG: hypothetical protein ABIA75_10535 [Candidatus Neomarinimicrobiota bacterium]